MSKRAIWLRTAKVVGQDTDGEAIKEVITVKLNSGKEWINFLNHLIVRGFSKRDFPKVVKVINPETKEEFPNEIATYQSDVSKYMAPRVEEKVDYAKENKMLKDELAEMKAMLQSLVSNKSDDRELLIAKGKELELKFAKNVKSDKLLSMIQEVEPEFSLNEEAL